MQRGKKSSQRSGNSLNRLLVVVAIVVVALLLWVSTRTTSLKPPKRYASSSSDEESDKTKTFDELARKIKAVQKVGELSDTTPHVIEKASPRGSEINKRKKNVANPSTRDASNGATFTTSAAPLQHESDAKHPVATKVELFQLDRTQWHDKQITLCLLGKKTSCQHLDVTTANNSFTPWRHHGDSPPLVLHESPSFKGFAVQFTEFGTYLSRDLAGNVAVDEQTPKSFEHWTFDFTSSKDSTKKKTSSACEHPVVLRPVPSTWQPEAGAGCISVRSKADKTHPPLQISTSGSGCAQFCAWLSVDEQMEEDQTVDDPSLGSKPAGAKQHVVRHYHQLFEDLNAERTTLAHVEPSMRKITKIELVLVSSIMPLDKLHTKTISAKQARGKKESIIDRFKKNAWVRQLSVLETWWEVLNAAEDGDGHCPYPPPEFYDVKVDFTMQVALCVERDSDVETLLAQRPDMFQRDGTGEKDDSASQRKKIVLSSKCETSAEFKIPTYRGIFEYGERHFDQENAQTLQLLMYSNSDILYSMCELRSSLVAAAHAFHQASEFNEHLFVMGRRRNCDVDTGSSLLTVLGASSGDSASHNKHHNDSSVAGEAADPFQEEQEILKVLSVAGGGTWDDAELGPSSSYPDRTLSCDAVWRSKWSECPMFEDTAQDYFIMSRGALLWKDEEHFTGGSWEREPPNGKKHQRWRWDADPVPPFVVGGIAFDNWLTSTLLKQADIFSVDASNAINALHMNHGGNDAASNIKFKGDALRESHSKAKSKFNSRLGHEAGGWSKGKTSLAPYRLVVGDGDPRSTSLSSGCVAAVHERFVPLCTSTRSNEKHYGFVHANQQRITDPPSAFDKPWERSD